MGRKNRRKTRKPPMPPWSREPEPRHRAHAPRRSRCAFCGRLLPVSGWHWFRDEFGQRVRKCNDERSCMKSRKLAAEESFRRAIRRNAYHTESYWMKEDRENGNE
jgi:hypothetical protein